MSSRIVALVAKDVRIHGRDIAVTQVAILALLGLMNYMRPAEAAVLASAVFNFNFLLAGFWSEWLISREKTKGTFAWMRACPVDDRDLVAAKFLAVAICCVSLWVVSSVMFLRAYISEGGLGMWLVLQLGLLLFGGLAIATRWRFGPKLGQMLPYGIAGALLGLLIAAEKTGFAAAGEATPVSWNPAVQAFMVAALLAAYVGIYFTTYRWVRGSDTSALLE